MPRRVLVIALLLGACKSATPALPPASPTARPPFPTAVPTATHLPLVTEQSTATAAPTPAPVSQRPDPDRAHWVPAVQGLKRPVDMGHVGDGRLFIVEQAGLIRIFQDGSLLQEPFLDIRGRVGDRANEQGLLGLAFHPRFPENGFFYLNYTDNQGDTLIARFQVSGDPNRADPDSEKILLRIDQPFPNHNGGGLRFGPDGMLYIGTGDGGSAGDPQGNGQSLDTLLGKILRIDVDGGDPYSIPPDNPFAAGGGRAEIWAYGLRNPWRFAFDPFSGALFIADVGQNQWEEIDLAPAGAGGLNFGWNHREGAHPFASARTEGLIDPIAEYGHSQGCSVTGGLVVNSPSLPDWRGVYLYADYCSGRVWGLWRGPGGEWVNAQLYHTDFSVSSFGVDAAGEVYLIDHRGTLYRLQEKP